VAYLSGFPSPTVEQLISLARYGGKNRFIAAREVSKLDPSKVDLESLLWLIEILVSDPESPEFSELGMSLGSLIERMDEQVVYNLFEKLMEDKKKKLLLIIVLSSTKARLDTDVVLEVVRRLISDESEEIRNGALSILKNFLGKVRKDEISEIIYELANSEQDELRQFAITALLVFKDVFDASVITDILLVLLDTEKPEIWHHVISGLESSLLSKILKSRKAFRELLNKIESIDSTEFKEKFKQLLTRRE